MWEVYTGTGGSSTGAAADQRVIALLQDLATTHPCPLPVSPPGLTAPSLTVGGLTADEAPARAKRMLVRTMWSLRTASFFRGRDPADNEVPRIRFALHAGSPEISDRPEAR
jgi:hypothetical protein